MQHTRIIERIQSEYLEMPGLRLTPAQAQRLCGVDLLVCKAVLDALVDAHFLAVNAHGMYARASEGAWPRPKAAKTLPITSQHVKLAS
jgi:hypothetical protein